MTAPFAVDTNIAVYAFSTDDRRVRAMELMRDGPCISMQLLNEFTSVSLRKRKVGWQEIDDGIAVITSLAASVRPLTYEVHDMARIIAQRYRLSFYDALVVSAARLDKCTVLYSEDMQHGLMINDMLQVTNPFLETR